MRVSWVLSEKIPKGTLDMKVVKGVAPSWGSWKTWKEYKTDNCVCTDIAEIRKLIKRAFHAVCNFYIMQDSYAKVGNPPGVKLFNGKFKGNNIDNEDDIVALNLAVPNSDIVLLSGFNFMPILNIDDKIKRLAREEYYFNVRELMKTHSTVQFVLVDYTHDLASWAHKLDNLTLDTIDSVTNLLA